MTISRYVDNDTPTVPDGAPLPFPPRARLRDVPYILPAAIAAGAVGMAIADMAHLYEIGGWLGFVTGASHEIAGAVFGVVIGVLSTNTR